jgi:hypothetical protein
VYSETPYSIVKQTVNSRIPVFWDVTVCSWMSGFRRFEGTCRLQLKDSGFIKAEGEMLLQNVGNRATQHNLPDARNRLLTTQ